MSKRFFPWALVYTLLAAVVIESTIAFLVPTVPAKNERTPFFFSVPPTVEETVIQYKIHSLLTDTPQPYDVVLLGDSSCLTGLNPLLIEKRTGLKVLNLGTIGWLYTEGHADILELYLQRFPPPKLLIYHATTNAMAAHEAHKIGHLNSFRDWCGIHRGNWFSRLPSYRLRYFMRSLLLSSHASPAEREEALHKSRGPYLSHADASEMLRRTHGFLPETRPVAPSAAPLDLPEFSTDAVGGLERIFRLGREKQFKVIVICNPIPTYFAGTATEGVFARLAKRLQQLALHQPETQIYSPLLRYYPDQDFATPWHLGASGVEKDSSEISAIIEKNVSR